MPLRLSSCNVLVFDAHKIYPLSPLKCQQAEAKQTTCGYMWSLAIQNLNIASRLQFSKFPGDRRISHVLLNNDLVKTMTSVRIFL